MPALVLRSICHHNHYSFQSALPQGGKYNWKMELFHPCLSMHTPSFTYELTSLAAGARWGMTVAERGPSWAAPGRGESAGSPQGHGWMPRGWGGCAKSCATPCCLMVTFAQPALTSSHRLHRLSLQGGHGLGPLCSTQLPWACVPPAITPAGSYQHSNSFSALGSVDPAFKCPRRCPIQCPGAELGFLLKPLMGGPAR